MKYFLYKTINTINGKIYYGAHSTFNVDDGYLGSGVALKRAIKKYGKENFERYILEYCESLEELYEKERILIAEFLGEEKCYNMKPGGMGGWDFVNKNGYNVGDLNVMRRCDEAKTRCIEAGKKTRMSNRDFYADIARKNGYKSKIKCTGVKCPSKGNGAKSKKMWEDNYDKMRDALASFFKVISPFGDEYLTNRLEDFCRSFDLTYTSVWNSSRTNKPVKKGKSKGWLCVKI